MAYDAQALSRIYAEMRRPYLTTGDIDRPGRDKLYDDRRDVLHRRARPWLPPKYQIFARDVLYRDPLPSFVVNYLTHRLGVNQVQYAVWLPGDPGPKLQERGQTLENWIRGCDYELDPLGFSDQRFRRHQAADGIGWYELDFGNEYTPGPPKDGVDYVTQQDKERRQYGLPCRLNAPDPRALYVPTGQTRPEIVVKVVNRQLIDVQNKWVADGVRLSYVGGEKLSVDTNFIYGGETPPGPQPLDVGKWVRCVVIATSDKIYHCIYPDALPGPNFSVADDSPGAVPNLILVGQYDNPLGHPPFYPGPARTTEDTDPAFTYQPLAAELLDMAPYINEMMTIRNIAAMREGLSPVHFQPRMPGLGTEATQPDDANALLEPGVWEKDGEFKAIPHPDLSSVDKYTESLRNIYQQFNTTIMGAAQAGTVGKTTAPWAIAQRKEEEASFLTEPLNTRANAKREVILDVIKLMRQKHAKDGPVYVTARARSERNPEAGHVDLQVGMNASDFDLDFRLGVTIDALTQSQRAAETEYGRRLVSEGTISRQTYEEEYAGIADRITETARKRREALATVGEAMALNTATELFKAQIRSIYGAIGEIVAGPAQPQTAAATGEQPPPPGPAQPPTGPQPSPESIPGSEDQSPYPESPGMGMKMAMPEGTNGMVPAGALGG